MQTERMVSVKLSSRSQERGGTVRDLSILSGAVTERTVKMIRASVSKNTLRAYRGSTKQLETWLKGRVLTDALLADYLAELFEAGKSPATIGIVVAAVKWREGEVEVSVVGWLTRKALAGIRREGIGRRQGSVTGVTWEQVDTLVACCVKDGTLKGLRDGLLIRLMSDCLLRISEAVAVNVEDFEGESLIVRQSKTDQEGEETALYVCDRTRCLLQRYRDAAKITGGALFRTANNNDTLRETRLSIDGARLAIKQRATQAGLEGWISGHSLRIGSAESLAERGATLVDMQTAGRWRDPKMPSHYARSQMAGRGAVARLRDEELRDEELRDEE